MKDRIKPIDKGERIGFAAERRFLNQTQNRRDAGLYPTWLGFFDKARPDEDAEGIDVWAYTDVGKIALQIKASRREKRKFEGRENRKHIPAINVGRNFDEVFKEVLEILSAERDERLAKKAEEQGK